MLKLVLKSWEHTYNKKAIYKSVFKRASISTVRNHLPFQKKNMPKCSGQLTQYMALNLSSCSLHFVANLLSSLWGNQSQTTTVSTLMKWRHQQSNRIQTQAESESRHFIHTLTAVCAEQSNPNKSCYNLEAQRLKNDLFWTHSSEGSRLFLPLMN